MPAESEVVPSDNDTKRDAPQPATTEWKKQATAKVKFILIVGIVVVQTIWAMAIPIKNVVVMPYPKLVDDVDSTNTSAYDSEQSELTTRKISGHDVYRILTDVVNLSINNTAVRNFMEEKGDFAVDEVAALLTPQEHRAVAMFYGMLFQASEFPAGGFVHREQKLFYDSTTNQSASTVTLRCSRFDVMQGMQCKNAMGAVCDDSDWNSPRTLQLTPVDLNKTTQGMGWQNPISMVGLVTTVDAMMRSLFQTKKWKLAYAANAPMWEMTIMPDPTVLQYVSDGMKGSNPFKIHPLDRPNDQVTVLESCFGSEILLARYYINIFAGQIIQQALTANNQYDPVDAVNITADFSSVLEDILRYDMHLTSGAGHQQFMDEQKKFAGNLMTQHTVSIMNYKRDRPMTGAMLMGSSPRNMDYLQYYPNSYYSYVDTWLEDNNKTFVTDLRQLGAKYAGYNGFKFDFTHNTMGVQRLSERRRTEGTGYPTDWFEQEAVIAAWYRKHEVNDSNSLIKLGERVWGPDSPTTGQDMNCMEGMFRKLTQTVWITALRQKPVLSHLVYMSMEDPDDPATWFYKQMLVTNVVGETICGIRVQFPFSHEDGPPINGESWVLITLLSAFLKVYSPSELHAMIMAEMPVTFMNLLEIEAGQLMFKDAVHCYVGWKTLGVNASDDRRSVWTKLNTTFSKMINETLHVVEAIHTQMTGAVGAATVIPTAYVETPRSNSIFRYSGPPVYWQHQPLNVGLMRLSASRSPTQQEMQPLRDSLRCYNTLEMRFLNISTRCWAEPQNKQEARYKMTSEGLRMLKFSVWSLGIVVNINAAVISFRFAHRIAELWRHSRFSDMGWTMALNLDIQGIGLLSMDGIVIMAFSSVPMILSYHLPIDPAFVPPGSTSVNENKVFAEFMVLLSLTWFVRLGIELGVKVIHLKHYNWWFSLLTSRIRLATIIIIIFIRLGMPINGVNYNQGLTKFIVSCVVSVVLGFLSVLLSVFFDKENNHSTDRLSRLMVQNRFPRNVHGVIGQLEAGWIHAGMLMEGWRVLKLDGKPSALVHGPTKLLPTDECNVQIAMLTPELLAQLQSDKIAPSKAVASSKISCVSQGS
ncbi:TPA: hypothetical protein N0F65_004560 [Lagenidium giganteum]|uniref:Uncharacterized protein n=1 Tax=Lagenidium giganteum TaxID=4803 RepID=A0AAV2ZD12_9STRA|nr:TPA: hypothetical protein N0F65_004560 [Lagenidium giganteum]